MDIYHVQLGPGELPIWEDLASASIHIAVPYNGWVRQKAITAKNPERPVVPLSNVKYGNIKTWLKDRVARLPTKKGCLIIIGKPLDETRIEVGLIHSTRRWKTTTTLPGLPERINV